MKVASAAAKLVALQHVLEAAQLVESLLEPELVDLMNDDEEQLIVLGAVREGLLERQ